MTFSKILVAVFAIILPLLVMYLERKKMTEEKEKLHIDIYPNSKKYKCVLTIKQKSGENISFTGYSDTKYNCIESFIKNCEWVNEKNDGYIIIQGNATIFMLKSSVQTISLLSEENGKNLC